VCNSFQIKRILVFILLTSSFFTNAQTYTSNLRAEANIPKIIANKALKQTFKGIYDVQASYCYYLGSGINLGVGVKNTYTQIDWQKFGAWHGTYYALYAGYTSLIYDVNVSDKQKASFAVDVGYGFNRLGKLRYDTVASAYQKNALFFQPKFQYHFYIDPNVAITLNISVSRFQTVFSPYPLKLEKDYSYKNADLLGYNTYINFGMGILTGFKGKRFRNVELPDYGSEVVPEEAP